MEKKLRIKSFEVTAKIQEDLRHSEHLYTLTLEPLEEIQSYSWEHSFKTDVKEIEKCYSVFMNNGTQPTVTPKKEKDVLVLKIELPENLKNENKLFVLKITTHQLLNVVPLSKLINKKLINLTNNFSMDCDFLSYEIEFQGRARPVKSISLAQEVETGTTKKLKFIKEHINEPNLSYNTVLIAQSSIIGETAAYILVTLFWIAVALGLENWLLN